MTELHEKNLPEEHPEHHEHAGVSYRPLVIFLVVFAIVMVGAHVFLYWLFGRYEEAVRVEEQKLIRSAVGARRTETPEPPLQGLPGFYEKTPREDMLELRREHEAELSAYAPAEEGFARIPIERAMEILLREGIPTAPQEDPAEPKSR